LLKTQDIPADRIIGTKSMSRTNVFSASFYPLADPDSEFAVKWMALCRAHLSETGIRDPIDCYEYLGDFYVQEGNKRTSVLKYFGASGIPAKIKRIMPKKSDNPRVIAYYEFIDFHKETGIYDIQFKKPGLYAKLYAAVGKKPKDEWTAGEISQLKFTFSVFKNAFNKLGNEKENLSAEEALLLFLKVYSYEELHKMTQTELKKALANLWGDVQAQSTPEQITVNTKPDQSDRKNALGKFISGTPKHLNVAFIYRGNAMTSPWTSGHIEGAAQLTNKLGGSVTVKNYFNADSVEQAHTLFENAVADGADVVFATTPPMLTSTLQFAVRYPKVRFFNCSASMPLSSVRSYYCRIYESKFVTGAIAGALAENDLIGYVGSYPILGVPASINAFALGVRMTNPRAKILLEWNCVNEDCVTDLIKKGASVISNRDVPLPDAAYIKDGKYGLFTTSPSGEIRPIASPCWMWGTLYEKIVRLILGGNYDKKDASEAVNYWWGMDSGATEVILADDIPDGIRYLANILTDGLKAGTLDPFMQRLVSGDGTVVCDGINKPTSMQLLHMNKFAGSVEGRLPEYGELLPKSKALVREMGAHLIALPTDTEE